MATDKTNDPRSAADPRAADPEVDNTLPRPPKGRDKTTVTYPEHTDQLDPVKPQVQMNDPSIHPTKQEMERAKEDPTLNIPLRQGHPLNPPYTTPRAPGEWPSGQPYQKDDPVMTVEAAEEATFEENLARKFRAGLLTREEVEEKRRERTKEMDSTRRLRRGLV